MSLVQSNSLKITPVILPLTKYFYNRILLHILNFFTQKLLGCSQSTGLYRNIEGLWGPSPLYFNEVQKSQNQYLVSGTSLSHRHFK